LLSTLQSLGYVERIEPSRRFRASLKCLELGFNAVLRTEARALIRPVLQGLVDRGVKRATLGILDAPHVVSLEEVGVPAAETARQHLRSDARGQVILAFLPAPLQRPLLGLGGSGGRVHPAIDHRYLTALLGQVRRRGHAVAAEPGDLALRTLAVPICDEDGMPLAALGLHELVPGDGAERFLDAALAAAAALQRPLAALHEALGTALPATPLRPAGAEVATRRADKDIQMYWWGSRERTRRTFKVNELYMKRNPGVAIEGNTLGWDACWPQLIAQAHEPNAPDIIQMDYRYLEEYARGGALLPLDDFAPTALETGKLDATALDAGRVDGKLYGISLGLNSTAALYNETLFAALGVAPPRGELGWVEFADLCAELTRAGGRPNFWGAQDGGGIDNALEIWLRQQGKLLFTAKGGLGFDESDIAQWFAYWEAMRRRGACVPTPVQEAEVRDVDTSVLTMGQAAIGFGHSNQLVGYQAHTRDKLRLMTYPRAGAAANSGQYFKPSQMWSISRHSRRAAEAIRIVNFYVTDLEAARVLACERGIPDSPPVRAALEGQLDGAAREAHDYIARLVGRVGQLPPLPPKGAGEVSALLHRFNAEIGFGRIGVGAAARSFCDEARAALARG
jgi:multiple sugar transport system substrate-binding protein